MGSSELAAFRIRVMRSTVRLAAIQSVSRPYDVLSLPTTFSVALRYR
jgi:hypothetical protein